VEADPFSIYQQKAGPKCGIGTPGDVELPFFRRIGTEGMCRMMHAKPTGGKVLRPEDCCRIDRNRKEKNGQQKKHEGKEILKY
jgi:hypothetical protein